MLRSIASTTLAFWWRVAVLASVLLPGAATATTKGLSQIVTPDIQPEGQLSLTQLVRKLQPEKPTLAERFAQGPLEAFGFGWDRLEWLTVNAMKSAFLPFDERLLLIEDVIKPGYTALGAA